jgi:hypothetical protein
MLRILPDAMTIKAAQMVRFHGNLCAKKAIAIVVTAKAVISHESI